VEMVVDISCRSQQNSTVEAQVNPDKFAIARVLSLDGAGTGPTSNTQAAAGGKITNRNFSLNYTANPNRTGSMTCGNSDAN